MGNSRKKGQSPLPMREKIQILVLALTLIVGIQFALYVFSAAGDGPMRIARPSSVEGFLPIGALMSWKRFFITGSWDSVHPAAMVIFGFVVLVSFFLRNAFCGWLCPVGTVSERLYLAGERLFGRTFRMPAWIDVPLRGLKYVLLGFFVWIIFSMSAPAIAGFQESPYYRMSDAKMLYFFLYPSKTTIGVLVLLAGLSMLFRHFWCRYLCPYGALTGLAAAIGPTRIRRDADQCVSCGKCRSSCPKHLPVDMKAQIATPECIGCMNCVAACDSKKALALKTAGLKRGLSAGRLGLILLLSWCVVFYAASVSGFWKSGVSDMEFRMRLRQIHSGAYEHPRTVTPQRGPAESGPGTAR